MGEASSTRNGEARVNENLSDDSGYGEGCDSFPSREDSSSSDNDENSSAARKPKPLAPTCTVCLVRLDLTTIWCEVTASIRTTVVEVEDDIPIPENKNTKENKKGSNNNNNNNSNAPPTTQENTESPLETNEKEVLLCLRPLRDGENVGEELRFDPVASKSKEKAPPTSQLPTQSDTTKTEGDPIMLTSPTNTSPRADIATNVSDNVSSSVNSANSSNSVNNKKQKKSNHASPKGLPFKKRSAAHESKALNASRLLNEDTLLPGQQHNSVSLSTTDTEKSVVESLMLMCNKPKT